MTSPSSNRPPIVIYSSVRWNDVWRPRREYAVQLARRGWRVLYTTGPLSIWDRGSEDWRNASVFGRIERDGNLAVDHAGRFPLRWPGHVLDRQVLRWHARRARSTLGCGDDELIAIVSDPQFVPHVACLRPRHVVYFQYEALGRLPDPPVNFHAQERELVEASSLVVSLTRQMAEVLPAGGAARARILPSAVRIENFLPAPGEPCPEDLVRVPRPRIGYLGSITVALDFDLIQAVARARPAWQFVFIGQVEGGGTTALRDPVCDAKWQALRSLPNVHYLPPQPAATVPAYMAHMDVNALWYRTSGDGWWLVGSPIKLYENLAVGRPVVGTSLAAVREFAPVVELADTPEQWLVALERALREEGGAARERRVAVAQENSWEKRAEVLESWLREMLSRSRVPAGSVTAVAQRLIEDD